MLEIPDSLVDRLKAREAALVAGLGCGELAGAPGWPALVRWLAARLPFPDDRAHVTALIDAGRLVDAIVLVRDLLAHGVARDAVREGYPDGATVPPELARAAGLPWRAVITTGFDDLWQQALGRGSADEAAAPAVVLGTDSAARLRSFAPRRLLMHLFGQATEPDSLCLGPGDARTRLITAGGLGWLGELYRRRSLVLVGFRSRDPDLMWLASWLATLPPSPAQHFIFLDVAAESDPDTEARLLALRTGLTVIACRGGTAEAIAALARLVEEIGQHFPPLEADVDLDAWLARWTNVPNDPEPREVLARAAVGLRNEERWDRLTELLLRRLPLQEDRAEQLAALDEVADIFRDRLNAPESALRAGLTALRLSPADDELWDKLRADASEAGAWSVLLESATDVADETGATPDGARLWHRIARVIRHDLGGKEDALAAYEQALKAEPDKQDIRDEQLAFLRELERWDELVPALQAGAAETHEPARASALLLEGAALLERPLGDAPGAIAAYERVLAIAPAAPVDEALERLYEREQRWADLVLCLERRARSLPPDEAVGPRRHRAALLADQLNDPDAAAAELEDLVTANPDDEISLALLENIYQRAARHEEYLGTLRRLAEHAADPEIRVARLRALAAKADTLPEGREWATRAREDLLRAVPLDRDIFAELLRDYRTAGRFTAMTEALVRHIDALSAEEAAVEARGEVVDEAIRAEKRGLLVALAEVHDRDLGDSQDAFDAYLAAERAGAQHDEIYAALVKLAERLEQWDAAADMLRRWAALTSGTTAQAGLRMQAARLLLDTMDDRAGAEAELEKVLALTPGNALALAGLARLRRQRGDYESASRLFLDAAVHELEPRTKAALLADAGSVVQYKLKDEDGALGLYVQALAADPEQMAVSERLAELYARRQQWGELEPLLDRLAARDATPAPMTSAETTPDPAAPATPGPQHAVDPQDRVVARHLQRAEVALALGKPDKALACFAEAFRLQPESITMLKRYAAFRLQQREWKEAGDLYASLRRLHRGALSSDEVLKITLVIAHCRSEAGDVEDAVDWYQDARGLDPTHRHAVEALARLHAHQKDWTAWVIDRRSLMAIAAPEERAALWEEIGDTYADRERMNAPADALTSYREALEAEPGRRSVLHKLLDLYTKQGQWEATAGTLAALAALETEPQERARKLQAAALLWKDQLDRPVEAAALLERALDDAPELPGAFETLKSLHGARGDWQALAQSYDRMIDRLPPGDTARLAALWNALGTLGLRHLNDRELALAAFETAATLEPNEARPYELLAELYVQGGADSRDKAIAAHHHLLAQDPNRVASYQALAKLYGEAGAFDKRWCIAATLSFLHKGDDTLEALFERLRPHQVRPASRPLTDELWQRILHPDEDPLIDALFAAAGALVAAPAAQPLTSYDLKRKAQIDVEKDPRPLVRALVQVASTLNAPMSDLFLVEEADAPSTILNVKGKGAPRPTLVLGPATTRRDDAFEVAFDTARLMSFLRPERFPRYALATPAALRAALQALLMLTGITPTVANADDGEAARLATHLRKTMASGLIERLRPIAQQLVDRRGPDVDVDRWLAGTELTAARAALLICGDLGAAARVIWGDASPPPPGEVAAGATPPPHAPMSEKERLKDLIAFSISEEYFACRAQLGVAVAA